MLQVLQSGLPGDGETPSATEMNALWEEAVRSHQRGDLATARATYARVLQVQPEHAPAHYLFGVALRDSGDLERARVELGEAIAAAPGFVEARTAAIKTAQLANDPRTARALCAEGIARTSQPLHFYRLLGQVELQAHDGASAAQAFAAALALDPTDAETHYNHGVALQMQRKRSDAADAYRRALAFRPDLVAAEFNLGVLHQEEGATDAAIAAYEKVVAGEPKNAAAYKNLGEALFAAGRIDAWLANFRRFEANCPDALALAVQALEACQHRGDYASIDRYIDGLRTERFRADTDRQWCDNLEELLYLLLFFDIEPAVALKYARIYDAAARRVYGAPLPRPPTRKPGRIRVGYVSADLRNHVMGKMMWQAVERHDRSRFALYFYSLSSISDEWTERFRGIADGFHVVADLDSQEAVRTIDADDLDLLVDLSTHTKGAEPGILALKPARVALTHIASAGTLGLSAIDYKLTDRFADLPENQAFQQETLLPIDGCIYPYRYIAPAEAHPFHRASLGISPEAVLIGAFVSPLKLSRRCLGLWRQILERIPRASLVFSPANPAFRNSYLRLASAAGIAHERLIFLPQGRDDAENQARYALIDFVLDPLPFGGANGTLEALDMGVPVVALVGKRHGERVSSSIQTNLGVTQTLAPNGREYVEIAVRLANEFAFMRDMRAGIRAGLDRSPLTDLGAHTRSLERAYIAALEAKAPAVLASAS